jgi:glycosyltransferase involved in cell wall biosynthesis
MTSSPPDPARSFRLLHFQSTAAFGGDESNSLLLCRHLPNVSHRVAVYFGSGPMEGAWRAAGAEVERLDLNPADRGGLIRAVRKMVSAVCPDGVFLSSVSLLPLVLKGLDGYTGEVLCHTGNPDASSMATRLKFWTARAWLRPTARLTMVHCSEYVRRSYSGNRFYRGYRHEVAISAGLIDARAGSQRARPPGALAREGPVRVGMVARLDPIKNHRLVIDAFRLMLASYPRAVLEFVGDGSERAGLEAHARKAGLSGSVVFHGRVPDPIPVMREWDLFLYGTTAAEGFGAALAEAMCLGLPCVVTDVGPMREVGGEEGAVRYVSAQSPEDFARAAVVLLGDRAERCQMSERAQRRAVATFGGSRFASRIAELLGLRAGPRSGRMAGATAA